MEWIRRRVSAGFNLTTCKCFDELLGRADGEEEEKIIRFLSIVTNEDSSLCLLFFKSATEEERGIEEVQISGGESEKIGLYVSVTQLAKLLEEIKHLIHMNELFELKIFIEFSNFMRTK